MSKERLTKVCGMNLMESEMWGDTKQDVSLEDFTAVQIMDSSEKLGSSSFSVDQGNGQFFPDESSAVSTQCDD
jgi:hypothetical protein